jgi:hypothetical protein
MAKRWGKWHWGVRHDRKLRLRCSPEERWCWAALFDLAGEQWRDGAEPGLIEFARGIAFTEVELADECGVTQEVLRDAIAKFETMLMLRKNESGSLTLVNFGKRQDDRDPEPAWQVSARARKARKRKKEQVETATCPPITKTRNGNDRVTQDVTQKVTQSVTQNHSDLVLSDLISSDPSSQEEEVQEKGKGKAKARAKGLDYDALWAAYPNKTAKHMFGLKCARGKIQTPELYERVLRAIPKFAERMRREGVAPKFCPHFATWINQERWTDEDDPHPDPNGQQGRFVVSDERQYPRGEQKL